MSKVAWKESEDKLYMDEVSSQLNNIPPGVYVIEYNPLFQSMYLRKSKDRFKQPSKIYNFYKDFEDRAIKTIHNTKGNIGFLLNGLRGTGKTIVGQSISNKLIDNLDFPCLIVSTNAKNFPEGTLVKFLSSINQDITVFIDEYEKIYNRYDDSLLTLMDGVMKSKYRRIFLFTTNSSEVNPNLLQRPSRLRYFKTFSDLSYDQIKEVVKDNLIDQSILKDTIEIISKFEIITVDIILSVIEEMNIHNISCEEAIKDFNIKKINTKFTIEKFNKDEKKWNTIHFSAEIFPVKFDESVIGNLLSINEYEQGKILKVYSEYEIEILDDDYNEEVRYRFKPLEYTHKSFLSRSYGYF